MNNLDQIVKKCANAPDTPDITADIEKGFYFSRTKALNVFLPSVYPYPKLHIRHSIAALPNSSEQSLNYPSFSLMPNQLRLIWALFTVLMSYPLVLLFKTGLGIEIIQPTKSLKTRVITNMNMGMVEILLRVYEDKYTKTGAGKGKRRE